MHQELFLRVPCSASILPPYMGFLCMPSRLLCNISTCFYSAMIAGDKNLLLNLSEQLWYNKSMKKYFLHREPAAFTVNYENDLNPEQYSAVMHKEGPALVLAGAGTGKTRGVTYRVARLLEARTRPENILLLTFTNKAAKEMMRRAEHLIGRNTSGLFGGTFHHIANLILRQHYMLIGYKQGFSILDREDSKELIEGCVIEVYKKDALLPKGAVLLELTSLSKNTDMTIDTIVLQR